MKPGWRGGRIPPGGRTFEADLICGEDFDWNERNWDSLSRDVCNEGGSVICERSPVEANVRRVEGEGDVGEVLDFISNEGAVESDPGLGRLNVLGCHFFDGTTQSSKELGGECPSVAICDGVFGKSNPVKSIVFEVPISTGTVEGVTGNEPWLGEAEICECFVGLNRNVFPGEAFEMGSLLGAVGSVKNEISVAKGGRVDVTQKRENEADAMTVSRSQNVAGQKGGAGRSGEVVVIGLRKGGAEEPEKEEGKGGGRFS